MRLLGARLFDSDPYDVGNALAGIEVASPRSAEVTELSRMGSAGFLARLATS